MAQTNSNKFMIVFVLLVVVLSVVFTWQALSSPDYGQQGSSGQAKMANAANPSEKPVLVTGGAVGISITPKSQGGA